jgi:hypothetical protein
MGTVGCWATMGNRESDRNGYEAGHVGGEGDFGRGVRGQGPRVMPNRRPEASLTPRLPGSGTISSRALPSPHVSAKTSGRMERFTLPAALCTAMLDSAPHWPLDFRDQRDNPTKGSCSPLQA